MCIHIHTTVFLTPRRLLQEITGGKYDFKDGKIQASTRSLTAAIQAADLSDEDV